MGIQTIFGLHFGKLLKTPRFKKVFFFFFFLGKSWHSELKNVPVSIDAYPLHLYRLKEV